MRARDVSQRETRQSAGEARARTRAMRRCERKKMNDCSGEKEAREEQSGAGGARARSQDTRGV